jgi:putative transposase
MGRSRYKVLNGFRTFFTTAAVVNWIPLFSRPDIAEIVLESLRYIHRERRLVLHAYVLLENHLHLVGSSPSFSEEMRRFKSFTARRIVDSLADGGARLFIDQLHFFKNSHKKDQAYQVWQEGFHPEAILDEKMLEQKVLYIHNNPVRRGYVDDPASWRYSSCRQYEGGVGLVSVEPVMV